MLLPSMTVFPLSQSATQSGNTPSLPGFPGSPFSPLRFSRASSLKSSQRIVKS